MRIKLEDINRTNTKTQFIGSRERLSSVTSVKFVDAHRLVAANLVGCRMYLIEFDVVLGRHKVLSTVDTQFAGQPMKTDLLDYDGRESIVTSDCGKCAVSLYRLKNNQLSFEKDIPIRAPDTAFCHGARFVPPGDVICALFSTGLHVYFLSKASGEIIYQFTDDDWRPKDASFISATKMVVLFAREAAATSARPSYDSKVSLISFDLAAKRHTIISEIVTKDSHVDCCCYADGRVYVNNQMRDGLLVFRVTDDQFLEQEHFGYDFPHGVDVLPSANLLAVTNYGCNSIFLGPIPPAVPPVLGQKSSVLAIVTHYQREQWLEQALTSLVAQTHPPDNIVVIDDGSINPPLDLLKKFPQATLLASSENVGPYRLLQEIVGHAEYDGYLIHDADDWSTPDLLALLLAEAEKTGAEIIGPQFEHVHEDGRHELVARPLNASAAYAADPTGHFSCFGASLISRKLLLRLGGFANGLRFGGDGEFFRRASHVAKLTNIPETCYFHRKHPGSLTQRPDTGMQSPARQSLRNLLLARARENAAAVERGEIPDLSPFAVAEPITLKHLCGPQLREKHQPAQLTVPSRKSPVFIVGMHRSGTSLTANLLRQCGLWLGQENELHGATTHNPDGHWENIAVTQVNDSLLNELGGGWDDIPKFPSGWLNMFPAQRTRAKEIHTSLARPTPWGWKDPRASLLMPFWLGLEPAARVVLCVRHPLEVAHSLQRRGLMSYSLGLKLWRDYNERLLADVPPAQRVVVHYEHFFTQPEKILKRFVEFCGLQISDAELTKMATTTKPELRHTKFKAEQLVKTAVAPEIIALYSQLCAEASFDDAPKPSAQKGSGSPRQIDLNALAHEMFLESWRWFAQKNTPVGARVAIVSKGDEELLRVRQRESWHFPRDEQGRYTGYHPADDVEALAQLAAVQAAGAQFFALPAAALWWLECYPEFHRHLEKHFTRLESHPQIGVIYDLRHSGEK